MILLKREIEKVIAAHGQDAYPFEGCGLLLGRIEDGANVVLSVIPVPNSWEDEEQRRVRFRIDDKDMLAAELEAADQGLDIIGIFHSHPDHPPIASPRDLAWATWPGYSYLITEVRNGMPGRSRSWQLLPDRSGFVEETLEISSG